MLLKHWHIHLFVVYICSQPTTELYSFNEAVWRAKLTTLTNQLFTEMLTDWSSHLACCHSTMIQNTEGWSIFSRNFLVARVASTNPSHPWVGYSLISMVRLLSHPLKKTCSRTFSNALQWWRNSKKRKLHPLVWGGTPPAFLHDPATSGSLLATNVSRPAPTFCVVPLTLAANNT